MANITTITTNVDIDYVQKDFSSASDAMISFANVNFGPGTSANRLWTDFNTDSFSRTWLELVAFTADVLFFYLDIQATQAYLQTATVKSAVKDIAKQFGFEPATATSASGDAVFTVTGAGTILRGFRVQSSNGQEFFLTNDVTAIAAGEVTGTVLQGAIVDEQFVAEGLQNEEFNLAGPNVIKDLTNLNALDVTPQLTVGGNSYSLVTSFIRHNGTDQPAITDSLGNITGGGGRVYTLNERPDGTPFIRFGDGVFGRKIVAGENIAISYRTGGGSAGNIGANTLTTLVDSNPIVSDVRNDSEFSGGADEQSIEQLRDLIPASLRTLERAVALDDYSDILEANFSEVFSASAEKNDEDPGVDLNVYVVPQGSGVTQITDNSLLLTRLSDYLERRKMVTIQFQIRDAFEISALIGLEVFISDTASKSSVTLAIQDALVSFFDLSTGGSAGTGIGFAENILIKDICEILDNIPGIERFEIKQLTYRPRIQENIVGLVTNYNSSEVSIFPPVSESEWLIGAAGPIVETPGGVIFNNDSSIGFTYTSGTGVIQYAFPVDLSGVAPGDSFRDDSAVDFVIFAVDTVNNNVTVGTGLGVDDGGAAPAGGGSIRNGSTSFESFKVFKKKLQTATNLSIDSITDNNLDLTVKQSTATALSARVLLDNSEVFVPSEFSTGDFFLVDAANNIWEITANDSNTITTSITAVNDAAITNVASGNYKIVENLIGSQVVFNNNIFNIQFNSNDTVFSVGAQFSQIGTIGDNFQISELQSNVGKLGVNLDLIAYDSGSGRLTLNGAPNLNGISSDFVLIDSDGQIFNVVGVDNRAQPAVFYSSTNQDTNILLEDSGLGSQVSQGFEVASTDTYAAVSFHVKKEGNIIGNLTARIVADAAGLPDLGAPVATSSSVSINDLSEAGFSEVVFTFTTPPTLSSGTQYHLVLSPDASYAGAETSGVIIFDNTGPAVEYTYTLGSGALNYDSAVDLSSVLPGHFFKDSSGILHKISAVDDSGDELILIDPSTSNPPLIVDDGAQSGDTGSVIQNDRVLIAGDTSSPAYVDGEFSSFDGASWSNSTLGPSAGTFTDADGNAFTEADLIFNVQGTKSIDVESNLTPILGEGATVSERYYDDSDEVSFILGVSEGTITSAADVNAIGRGTVGGNANSNVDTFVFRSSRFADDIVNIRLNEIPQLNVNNIDVDIFGGID